MAPCGAPSAENGIPNPRSMERRWLPSLLVLLLIPGITSCERMRHPSDPNQSQQGLHQPLNRQAERQAQTQSGRRQEQERCFRERPGFEVQMAALRRAEAQLALVKEDVYVPLPGPDPWDETRESRYRQEDRDADWQQHLQAQEAWQRREQSRRSSWMAHHVERLRKAQGELNRQAQKLRARRPDLFTGPESIEFNPEVAERLRHC